MKSRVENEKIRDFPFCFPPRYPFPNLGAFFLLLFFFGGSSAIVLGSRIIEKQEVGALDIDARAFKYDRTEYNRIKAARALGRPRFRVRNKKAQNIRRYITYVQFLISFVRGHLTFLWLLVRHDGDGNRIGRRTKGRCPRPKPGRERRDDEG